MISFCQKFVKDSGGHFALGVSQEAIVRCWLRPKSSADSPGTGGSFRSLLTCIAGKLVPSVGWVPQCLSTWTSPQRYKNITAAVSCWLVEASHQVNLDSRRGEIGNSVQWLRLYMFLFVRGTGSIPGWGPKILQAKKKKRKKRWNRFHLVVAEAANPVAKRHEHRGGGNSLGDHYCNSTP